MSSNPHSVAYLGPEASFTHQASLTIFAKEAEYKYQPSTSIPAIFDAVRTNNAIYGVVPFYNSTYGAVIATLDCLTDELTRLEKQKDRSTSLMICGEVKLQIRHFLLGQLSSQTNSQLHESSLGNIKKVLSHEQALGQCSAFLDKHVPQAERVAVSSTSRAAEIIASGEEDADVAAISSSMAAEFYNVPILHSDIQDRNDNTTRFFVLERCSTEESQTDSIGDDKLKSTSLIVFTVSHSAAGALVRTLTALLKHNLNMVGISQRPPNADRQDDAIFVEVEGKVNEDVLVDLRREASTVRLLGTWQHS